MSKTVGNTTGGTADITVATGAGNTDADTQRVVVATDQAPISTFLSSPSQVAYGQFAKVSPMGGLSVETGMTNLMFDPFDTALDTVNRWTTSGTTRPTSAAGSVNASLGATNSVSSVLASIPYFGANATGMIMAGQMEVGSQQTNPNAHSFFGMGVVTSYASSTPVTDGFGFERDVTGAFNCVVYVGGTRYVANSTNPALVTAPGGWAANMVMSNYYADVVWPTSGTAIVMMRILPGFVHFFLAGGISGLDVPIALASWVPSVVSLPVRFASISTPAVSTVLATTFKLSGFVLGAPSGSNQTVSDPVYPWRQAGVNTTVPLASDGAMSVRLTPSDIFRTSFANAYSGAVDPDFTLLQTGAGMAVNQTGGNLVITSGTTANSETIIRSVRTFRGALTMRYKTILSQRIVNNNFIIELADLIQDAATYAINSATSVTVTFTSNPFTVINVGQFVNLGAVTGAAGLPGRYAIASVSGLTVTFTVAAWPGSGSGTVCVYGWNYIRADYNGTTATAVGFDTQRRGWNTGDTALTINTTASPGHIGAIQTDNVLVDYSDSLVATNTTPQFVSRGSRLENIPNDDTAMYLFIRVLNGTTNPATTTTWTVGLAQIELLGNQKVFVAGSSNTSGNRATPSTILSGTLTTVSTVTTLTGTTTLTPGTGATNLGKAEDAVAASGDTGVMALAVQRAAPSSNAATGDYVELQMSPSNGLFVAPSPIVVPTVLTPTIDTAIYASGDRVGSVITIPAALATGRAGQLVGATLVDKSKQKATLELHIFKVSPTLVGADNAAYDVTDANLLTALPVGKIDFLAADYYDTASNSMCPGTFKGGELARLYGTSGSANLFGIFVSRGTPTYAAATDLVVEITVTQF